MPVVACPGCAPKLKVPFEKIATFVRCPSCKTRFNPREWTRHEVPDVLPVESDVDEEADQEEDACTKAVGRNGEIELLERLVIIRRKGFVAFITQGFNSGAHVTVGARGRQLPAVD